MERRFGAGYARSIAADYRITMLGATVDEALSRGDSPKSIWRAICQEFEIPAKLQ